jgi:hypothetical protein
MLELRELSLEFRKYNKKRLKNEVWAGVDRRASQPWSVGISWRQGHTTVTASAVKLSQLIWCVISDPCNYEIVVNKSYESLYFVQKRGFEITAGG